MSLESILDYIWLIIILVVILIYYLRSSKSDRYEFINGWISTLKKADPSYRDDLFEFFQKHPNKSVYWCLKEFLTDDKKSRILKDIKNVESSDSLKIQAENQERQKYIQYRKFAYEHEDFIFSLFSDCYCFRSSVNKWVYPLIGKVRIYFQNTLFSKSDIVNKIASHYNINIKEAESLFRRFIDTELLYRYDLILHHPEMDKYGLGKTLQQYANIISYQDSNVNSWVINNKSQNMRNKDFETSLPF